MHVTVLAVPGFPHLLLLERASTDGARGPGVRRPTWTAASGQVIATLDAAARGRMPGLPPVLIDTPLRLPSRAAG